MNSLVKRLATPVLMLALAIVLGEILYVTLGENFFAVVPGEIYRGSQPTPARLDVLAKSHGIRTVVNLRGPNDGQPWYDAERAAAERLGLAFVNLPLGSNFPPRTSQLHELIRVVDTAERPILIHCQAGGDRTGLASMICRLLNSDDTLEQARAQISYRYGHKFWSEAARLQAFADAYAEWLAGRPHTPARFREWAGTVYRDRDVWRRLGLEPIEGFVDEETSDPRREGARQEACEAPATSEAR